MPAIQHKFRLNILNENDWQENTAMEVEWFEYDLANQSGKFRIRVPLVGNGVENSMRDFAAKEIHSSLVVEYLDGSGLTPAHSLKFDNLNVSSCVSRFDYAVSDTVGFDVNFTYARFTSTKREKDEELVKEHVEPTQLDLEFV